MSTPPTSEDALPSAAHMRRNLLPRMHAPMRTFMVAVMVMVWLAALADGAWLLVRQAIGDWTRGVVAEATAQVLPLDGERAEQTYARARRVAKVLAAQPGVRAARALTPEESRALLEPWLGTSGMALDLPIPVLVAVRLDPESPARIEDLRRVLKKGDFRQVTLDSHGRWVRELSDLAQTSLLLGAGVLVLLLLALVVLVTHAARSALEANRGIIEVLHLIGARDQFIARQVELHFLRSAFLAASAGVGLAWLTFTLLALLAPSSGIRESVLHLLFGLGEQTAQVYLTWLLIVVVTTLVSLTAARIAAMRILATMFREAA